MCSPGFIGRGDADRNAIVEQHLGLAEWGVRAYHPAALRDRDLYGHLVGAAYLGLLRAARDWDPRRGTFATYAGWWLRAFIGQAARQWGLIRVPRRIRGDARRKLLAELKPQPLEARPRDVQRLSDPRPGPAELASKGELPDQVGRAMGRLAPREALVIRRHYFDGWNLAEIAAEVNVCRERVRQIRCEALAKLRSAGLDG